MTLFFHPSTRESRQAAAALDDQRRTFGQRQALVTAYRWVKNNEASVMQILSPDSYQELLSRLWLALGRIDRQKEGLKKEHKAWRAAAGIPLYIKTKPKPYHVPYMWLVYEMKQLLLRKVCIIQHDLDVLNDESKIVYGCAGSCVAQSATCLAALCRDSSCLKEVPFQVPNHNQMIRGATASSRFLRQIALVELPEYRYDELPYSDAKL